MIESFVAGFFGVLTGVGVVSYLFFELYKKEQKMAKELSEKFLSALQQDMDPTPPKKKTPVDFLSLIKTDKEPPIN
jgi:hypothetical protein